MPARSASPDRNSAALLVPAAMVATNLISYALLLVAARVLARIDFGALLSLLGVLLVAAVPSLAMQTIAARRTAVGAAEGSLVRATIAVVVVSTALLAAASPALYVFLHLHSAWGLVAVVASVPGVTVLGSLQGIAQGERSFAVLAELAAATVGVRSIGGLLGLLVGRGATACLVGAALGVTAAAAVAVLRDLRRIRAAAGDPTPLRALLVEAAHAAHGHGAFLLVTSIDVLLARHVLSGADAGTYAAGSVVTRATLWLPQAVAVLMFASFTDHHRHRRAYAQAVALVALIGTVTVTGVLVLGRLAVSIVAGARYHVLDTSIWLYAVLGVSLAVLQLSIVAGLALRRPGRIALIWAVAAADIALVLGTQPDDAIGVVRLLAIVSVLGAVASVGVALLRRGDEVVDVQLDDSVGQGPGRNPGSRPGPNALLSPDASG